MAPLPKLVAIEFPGVLRDPTEPSRALEAIGGQNTVRSYVSTPPSSSVPRLCMNLRPCEHSQSNIKAEPPRETTNLFLIQLTPVPVPKANTTEKAANVNANATTKTIDSASTKAADKAVASSAASSAANSIVNSIANSIANCTAVPSTNTTANSTTNTVTNITANATANATDVATTTLTAAATATVPGSAGASATDFQTTPASLQPTQSNSQRELQSQLQSQLQLQSQTQSQTQSQPQQQPQIQTPTQPQPQPQQPQVAAAASTAEASQPKDQQQSVLTPPSAVQFELPELSIFPTPFDTLMDKSSATNTVNEDVSSVLPSDSPPPSHTWTAKLVGRVTALTEFRSLADFQYHPSYSAIEPYEPCDAVARANKVAESIGRTLHITTDRHLIAERVYHCLNHRPAKNFTSEQSIDRLRPLRFARLTLDHGNFNYWYRQYSFPPPVGTELPNDGPLRFVPGQPLGNDRRSQPDRLRLLPHRVSYHIDSVPEMAPMSITTPVVRGRAAFAKLVTLLRLLFQQRPVWVRRALLLGVPAEMRANFKKAIACVAYSFRGSGAFFQACVKYGYDPRKDPNSRQYQVIEVRCGHPLHEAVRTMREEEQERKMMEEDEDCPPPPPQPPTQAEDTLEQIPKHKRHKKRSPEADMDLEEQLAIVSGVTVDMFKMPAEFVLDDVPAKKNNFYQICDVKLESIRKVIDNQSLMQKYDSKSGFFKKEGMALIMKVIKRTLYHMSEDVLGKDRAVQILREHRYPVRPSKCSKRGRLHLKDIIKADTPKDDNKRVTRSAARLQEKKQKADSTAGVSSSAAGAAASSADKQNNKDGGEGDDNDNDNDDDDDDLDDDVIDDDDVDDDVMDDDDDVMDDDDDDVADEHVQMTVLDEEIEAQGEYVERVDVSGQLAKGAATEDEVEVEDDDDGDDGDDGEEGAVEGEGVEGEVVDDDDDDDDEEEEELTGFEVYDDDDDDNDDARDEDYEGDDDDDDDDVNYL